MERVVEQMDHAALHLMATRPELFARQGTVVATWRLVGCVKRTRSARCVSHTLPPSMGEGTVRYGPYYCLSYRNEGRQRSIYLGREGPLVEAVRRTLAGLQQPRRQWRAIERLRRQVGSALRIQKGRLDVQLRAYGLRLQGFEVRGWRTSLLRALTRPKPPTIRPLEPIRPPNLTLRGPKPIRPLRVPRYKPRSLAPAAIEERLWQVIAARHDSS